MAKLTEIDIPIVVSLLKEGQNFNEIAKVLEVSNPTLTRFLQENDLYKYSTNKRSVRISKSLTKSNNNDDNTLKSIIEDVMDHANDLYDEEVSFLEDLLKKGISIGKIARMYHRDRGTVREYLKKIGLYNKYCSGNSFEKGSKIRQIQREIAKEETKSENITVRPKYAKTIVSKENTLPVSIGVQSIEKEKEKPVNNDIVKNDNIQEDNNTNIVRQLTIEDLQNNGCFVNDVVLDYINKNIKTISLQAKLESITNTMMDSLINIFSEEELKDGNIKVEIKRTLVKLVEELL